MEMQEYSAATAPAEPAGTQLPVPGSPEPGGLEQRPAAAQMPAARKREDPPARPCPGGGDAPPKEGLQRPDGGAAADGQPDPPGQPDPQTAALLAGLLAAAGRQREDPPGQPDAAMRELAEYRRREQERLLSDDLAAIRAAHPEESARSVAELGRQFLAICASGVDPLCAYEAVQAHRQRTAPPPSTGDFGGEAPPKEFFTRDEVARMSRGEIHRNFDKIRRSMSHWNF